MAITAEQALTGAASPPRKSYAARLAGIPFVVPALLVVLAVMSCPFVYSVYLSFRSTPSYTTATTFAGLANYVKVLHDQTFTQALGNTVTWALASTVLGVLLGLGAALLVQQLRFGRGPIRAVLMLPYIVGYVVASYAWLWLYQGEYGLINVTLQSWHLTSHPISFLSSLTWAFPAVILTNVWKTFPFAMVMLLAGLQGVPTEPVLAARLDRAARDRRHGGVHLHPGLGRIPVRADDDFVRAHAHAAARPFRVLFRGFAELEPPDGDGHRHEHSRGHRLPVPATLLHLSARQRCAEILTEVGSWRRYVFSR